MMSVPRRFSHEQVARYVDRIGVPIPPEVTVDWLDAAQRAHLAHVPFEALNICPLDHQLSLDPFEMYDKIVDQHRGGYCFELNGLLGDMLEAIGFGVHRYEARFVAPARGGRLTYDHLMLGATIPGDQQEWAVDVGAGRDGPMGIVPFAAVSDNRRYRVAFQDEHWELTEVHPDGSERGLIEWLPDPVRLHDFADRHAALQDDPESPFRQAPLCTIVTESGRDTLAGWTLIETRDGNRSERVLQDAAEVHAILRERFGIDLGATTWWDGPKP